MEKEDSIVISDSETDADSVDTVIYSPPKTHVLTSSDTEYEQRVKKCRKINKVFQAPSTIPVPYTRQRSRQAVKKGHNSKKPDLGRTRHRQANERNIGVTNAEGLVNNTRFKESVINNYLGSSQTKVTPPEKVSHTEPRGAAKKVVKGRTATVTPYPQQRTQTRPLPIPKKLPPFTQNTRTKFRGLDFSPNTRLPTSRVQVVSDYNQEILRGWQEYNAKKEANAHDEGIIKAWEENYRNRTQEATAYEEETIKLWQETEEMAKQCSSSGARLKTTVGCPSTPSRSTGKGYKNTDRKRGHRDYGIAKMKHPWFNPEVNRRATDRTKNHCVSKDKVPDNTAHWQLGCRVPECDMEQKPFGTMEVCERHYHKTHMKITLCFQCLECELNFRISSERPYLTHLRDDHGYKHLNEKEVWDRLKRQLEYEDPDKNGLFVSVHYFCNPGYIDPQGNLPPQNALRRNDLVEPENQSPEVIFEHQSTINRWPKLRETKERYEGNVFLSKDAHKIPWLQIPDGRPSTGHMKRMMDDPDLVDYREKSLKRMKRREATSSPDTPTLNIVPEQTSPVDEQVEEMQIQQDLTEVLEELTEVLEETSACAEEGTQTEEGMDIEGECQDYQVDKESLTPELQEAPDISTIQEVVSEEPETSETPQKMLELEGGNPADDRSDNGDGEDHEDWEEETTERARRMDAQAILRNTPSDLTPQRPPPTFYHSGDTILGPVPNEGITAIVAAPGDCLIRYDNDCVSLPINIDRPQGLTQSFDAPGNLLGVRSARRNNEICRTMLKHLVTIVSEERDCLSSVDAHIECQQQSIVLQQ